MERIISPIRTQDRGSVVANLQEAMLFIAEKRQLSPHGLSPAQWRQTLSAEMPAQSFGERTSRLFAGLRDELKLPGVDFVNEAIARRLNEMLEGLGAFSSPTPGPGDSAPSASSLSLGAQGPRVVELHASLRQLGYAILLSEEAAQTFGETTHSAVSSFQQSRGLASNGIVDTATAAQISTGVRTRLAEPFVVIGMVRRADGSAVQRAVVRAFDADFRREEALGEAVTDSEGRYAITYSAERFARVEKESADLVVRVVDAGGRVLAASAVLFNAPREAVVDLMVEAGARRRSEYERHMALIGQLAPDVSPADFTSEDVKFLNGETRIRGRLLAFLVVAHRSGRETGAPPAAFYGLFRQGLPSNLQALLLTPLSELRRSLERSIKENIIPAELSKDLDRILEVLKAARATHVVRSPVGGNESLSEILATSGVSASSLEKFLNLYLEHSGRPEAFWNSLKEGEQLPKADVEALRFTLQLALITRNNSMLVKRLRQQAGSMPELVRLGAQDWLTLIKAAHAEGMEFPEDLFGETDEERIKVYSDEIFELLQDALPMEYLRLGLERDTRLPAQRKKDLTTFFSNAPGFDLLEAPVHRFLAANGSALNGVADAPGVATELKRMQRVFRLTQRYEATSALLSKGWDSALIISETPFTRFLESVEVDIGGPEKAWICYKKAKQTAASSASIYGTISQYQNDVMPAAVGEEKPLNLDGIANWEQLFEPPDFCECRHCRSVYGPAAYLVDLLQFLRRDGPPFTALMLRRPDLEHLKLTCENTNTPLPYVDLVNEIMEFFVLNGAFKEMLEDDKPKKAKELAKDTGDATAEELSINPQWMDENAYQPLLNAVFSFRLPFNRPIETARVYLEHLGSSLHEIMSTFQNSSDPNQPVPNNLSVAREYLKITPEELTVIAGTSAALARQFFGYADDQVVHKKPDDTTVTESWRVNLARAPQFLRRTGVSFGDVVDLLKTRFINPVQDAPFPAETVVLFSPGIVCDLNQTWIQRLGSDNSNLDATGLDDISWVRIHRFLRLWNKLGWTQQELDWAILTLGSGDINGPFVESISHLATLRAKLDQPVVRLLSFWSNIDTFGEDSLYLKLFQNKAITNPLDLAFELDEQKLELDDTAALITDHAATLQAALRVSAEELALLREATGFASEAETLDLAKISALYRHTILGRALKLKVREFLALKVLAGANIFDTPAATAGFVERVDRTKASPFKVAELNYLFRHLSEPGKGVGPAEDVTLILLKKLQTDLLKIVDETKPVTEPTSDMLRSKLALVLEATAADIAAGISQATVVDTAMEIIEGLSKLSLAEQGQFIDDHFAKFMDPVPAKVVLLAPISPGDEQAKQTRREFVLPPLLIHLRDVLSRSLVKQTLSTALPLEAELVQLLSEEILAARTVPGEKAIADFLSLAEGIDPGERLQDFIRLHKISFLVARFEARPEEVSYIFGHGDDFGGFDPNGMPLDRTDPAAVDANAVFLFSQWELLRDFFALRDRLPQGDLMLVDVLKATSPAEARANLSTLTGWDSAEVEFLCSSDGIGVLDEAFKNVSGPQRLFAAFTLSRKLGVSVKQLRDWAQQPLTQLMAQDIVHAVKAKYDDEGWLTAAKPLNDDLREKRKQALIAYLLAHPQIVAEDITNSNELYEYFLIDVNMDPCMMTSRVKQAISTVQLFIQRSLLNLEDESTLSPQSARRWLWMKNYRVWEANRKVFLYPENWIEPDLRDDKSPFFKELETQLLQNDLTPETVEQVLMTYLEKLDDVGRLEACGMCRERKDGVDTVHVFARTFNIPHTYYYRRYNVLRNRWSPWEKVPVDIEGDHLIPVVWNRRLQLFWPVFVEKPDKLATSALPEGSDPFTLWEIKMAWSEYRQGRWTPKQVSASSILSPVRQRDISDITDLPLFNIFYLPKKVEHYFRAAVSNDGLGLLCFRKYDSLPDSAVVQTVEGGNQAYHPNFKAEVLMLYGDVPDWHIAFYEIVGNFVFTGCRGRAEVDDVDELVSDSRREPKDTFNVDMAFESKPSAEALTLQGKKKTYVLSDIETPFSFLPPQEISDLGTKYYPFVFQDAKRAYFAMPMLDDPRPAKLGLANPGLVSPVENDDAVISEVPIPDLGDPGPIVVSQKPMWAYKRALPGTAMHLSPFRVMKGGGGSALLLRDERMTSGLVAVQELHMPAPQMMKKKAGGPGSEKADLPDATTSAAAKYGAGVVYLKFHVFFHPHVCGFIKTLNRFGVPGLLTLGSQQMDNDPANDTIFDNTYDPSLIVHDDYPQEDVDFRLEGAYSLYNWELFFHAPLLIADRLSKSQRFEEAMKWFHYIFNPIESSAGETPAKYWRFLPFNLNDEKGRIEDLLKTLNEGTGSEKQKLVQQVEDWRDNPFNPHLIARARMIAYRKTVVMKYIENIINWGDLLFTRDTLESINEATQLYVLAYNLLGRRPERIPPRLKPKEMTYAELQPGLDAFSNAMVELENAFPFTDIDEAVSSGEDTGAEGLGTSSAFYFCIPPNDKLLSYWDLVEDRLFKIRHCMNIEGVVRQLPLFEPPIDPALLVKAAAAGLDLSSVLADANAPLVPYRFQFLLQRATDFCSEVKSLGQALLSVLEKKDAEALSALRAGHETAVLEAAREAKRQHVQESQRQLEAIQKSRKLTEERQIFYQQRITKPLIPEEQTQLQKLDDAHRKQSEASDYELNAQITNIIPMIMTSGLGMSSGAAAWLGGQNFAAALSAYARFLANQAADASFGANMNAIMAGHVRSLEEWKLQLALATKELAQIDKQMAAAEIRIAMAEKDVEVHDKQIENAKSVEEFLRNKYTNQELYGWMLGQISAVYFQSYKLAYDVAKRAERAFRFERGLTDSSFIQFGYWDSFTKGLLAGEKLLLDLRRLEVAYLDQNRRELEITKHVSLMLQNPLALIQLKETGRCELELSEALFDADYPGHYMRRNKSVSLTMPCVTGPYTGINCTLTLLSNKVRISSNAQGEYAEQLEEEDMRFVTNFAALQSIATSHAQNDSGLFELNFRDERYLPFEGAGVISRWRIELPKDTNAFDFNTLTDVVLHLKYTARDGGEMLKNKAKEALQDLFESGQPLVRLFSLKHEFPTKWHRFLHPTNDASLALDLTADRFPFQFRGKSITISELNCFLKPKGDVTDITLNINVGEKEITELDDPQVSVQSLADLEFNISGSPIDTLPFCKLANTSIEVPRALVLSAAKSEIEGLVADNLIDDIWIVCQYSIT